MSDLNFTPTPTLDAAIPPRARASTANAQATPETTPEQPEVSPAASHQGSFQPQQPSESEVAAEREKARWREEAAIHKAAAQSAAMRATAALESQNIVTKDSDGAERVLDPHMPRWFVGQPSIYKKTQAQYGELAFKKSHGKVSKIGFNSSLGLFALGVAVGIVFPVAGIYIAFSAAFPLLAVGLRNEEITKKMTRVVKKAALESVAGQDANKVINELADAVNATTTTNFEGLVARAAFQDKLTELRKAGKSPSLSVRNTAVRHRIR